MRHINPRYLLTYLLTLFTTYSSCIFKMQWTLQLKICPFITVNNLCISVKSYRRVSTCRVLWTRSTNWLSLPWLFSCDAGKWNVSDRRRSKTEDQHCDRRGKVFAQQFF